MEITTAIVLILAALLVGSVVGARGDAMAHRRMGKIVKANTRSQERVAELLSARVEGDLQAELDATAVAQKSLNLRHQETVALLKERNETTKRALAELNTTLTLLCETLASEAAYRAERDVGSRTDEVPGPAPVKKSNPHTVHDSRASEEVTGPVTQPKGDTAKGRKYVVNKATGMIHRTGRFRQSNGSVVSRCWQAPSKSSSNYSERNLMDQEMLDLVDDPKYRMCRNCNPVEVVTK